MQIVDEKSFKILVATENQTYRNNVGSKLRMEGFNVEYATGGFHILHLLEKEDYNLILFHENMHDMPANEVISILRNRFSKAELPVITVALKRTKEEIIELLESGANEFIVQSTNFTTITDRARKYFISSKNP